jgi:hypothetical protein
MKANLTAKNAKSAKRRGQGSEIRKGATERNVLGFFPELQPLLLPA